MDTLETKNNINPLRRTFMRAIAIIAVSSLYLQIHKAEPVNTDPADFYKDASRMEVYQSGRRAVFNISAVGLSVELTYCDKEDLVRERLGFFSNNVLEAENYSDCADGYLSEHESLVFRPEYDEQP